MQFLSNRSLTKCHVLQNTPAMCASASRSLRPLPSRACSKTLVSTLGRPFCPPLPGPNQLKRFFCLHFFAFDSIVAVLRAATLGLIVVAVLTGVAQAHEIRSLEGRWKFHLDDQKIGINQKWYAASLAGDTTIKLPGTMDDAGLGPSNTKPPTLAGPYRLYDYAGPAWYQRDIEIPGNLAGQRVSLFLERCRWVTSVWLDDKFIGSQDSLIAPHVYDFGTGVAPGKHRLTICVDNTVKIDLGTFVSALFGGTPGNMNGIIGRIELHTTPPVWIEDVQVYPDADRQQARVMVKIGNVTGSAGHGSVSVAGKSVEATWDPNGGQVEIQLDMSGVRFWDEFLPNMQELTVKLGTDSRIVRFGMRKFTANGTQFTMNDRPLFLRGTLECSVWPLTGYPPTDVPSWQRIYRIMKSYGLNFIRFHSWCPPEAAFAAADVEGILIQAEGPQANVEAGKDSERDAFIEAEFKRIVDTYGNHPSFCTMTLGNEYGGNDALLMRWIDMLKQRDPRHLYSSASEGQKTANRQWTELMNGRGIHGPGTQLDLRDVVASDARPIVGHEIGQWMFFPNFDEIKKYTGVMKVRNFEMIRDDLQKKHLLDLVPKFAQACGNHAVLLYKEEIELLRRTPGYAGFSLLDLHDYPTQGTALVGPLDPFWDSKGFITPAAYRKFCGPTVPLLRIPKRTYTSEEKFTATADVSHFGPVNLLNVTPEWIIKDGSGRKVASGKLPTLTASTGKLTPLGAFSASLAKTKTPGKLTVSVSLAEFSNDWDIWVYPPARTAEAPSGVVVSRAWDDSTKAELTSGNTVVLFPKKTNRSLSLRGSFVPVFWSPVWFPDQQPNANGILCDPHHPAFAQFPTDLHSNWQWWELLNNSRTLILDDTPPTFRPIVQVVDNFARNHKLGNLFEARVGNGKLLVCTMDLPGLANQQPAANQLLKSLYDYAGSSAFRPKQPLDEALLDRLFASQSTNMLQRLGAKIRADSEAVGHEAELAIDDDPNTCWHTKWEPSPTPMPHELVIDFGREVTLTGITYLPRQDMANGRIAECDIFAENRLVGSAKWPDTSELQILRFPHEVTTRTLRFVVKSEVNGNPFASIAELDVLVDR
jgi:beta-galactosidase